MGVKKAKLVIVLHSHLPWVMGCGRWPFGEEWIYEIAWGCYLPLIRSFDRLAAEGINANVTFSVTPVLLEQLASPDFRQGFADYLRDRKLRVGDDRARFLAEGSTELAELTVWMEAQLAEAIKEFEAMGRDIPGALARLAGEGRIELATSAATHGYLPLLKREFSRRLQLGTGMAMFERITGMKPRGFWLPECAYRPGLEELIEDAGYAYTVLDATAVEGGQPRSPYGDSTRAVAPTGHAADRIYLLGASNLAVFPRNPELCSQVWSKWAGYPGDFEYREFHMQNQGSGMRYYRVTDSKQDLGTKQPYRPSLALARAAEHAAHMLGKVKALAQESQAEQPVFTLAFDTELFGHWWLEGPAFLEHLARLASTGDGVAIATGGQVLAGADMVEVERIDAMESSWGVNSDHSVWMNERSLHMWERIWQLEAEVEAHATALAGASGSDWPADPFSRGGAVNAVAKEFLLTTASDWEFLLYTGTASNYPELRFETHAAACQRALAELGTAERGGEQR